MLEAPNLFIRIPADCACASSPHPSTSNAFIARQYALAALPLLPEVTPMEPSVGGGAGRTASQPLYVIELGAGHVRARTDCPTAFTSSIAASFRLLSPFSPWLWTVSVSLSLSPSLPHTHSLSLSLLSLCAVRTCGGHCVPRECAGLRWAVSVVMKLFSCSFPLECVRRHIPLPSW